MQKRHCNKTIYTIWCEWDVGQYDIAFTSEAKARKWCQDNEDLMWVVEQENPPTLDALMESGLLSIDELEVI